MTNCRPHHLRDLVHLEVAPDFPAASLALFLFKERKDPGPDISRLTGSASTVEVRYNLVSVVGTSAGRCLSRRLRKAILLKFQDLFGAKATTLWVSRYCTRAWKT